MRIGGEAERALFRRDEPEPWAPEDMGMAIASLDRADVRQSAHGIYVHSDEGKRDVAIEAGREMGTSQRRGGVGGAYDAGGGGEPGWADRGRGTGPLRGRPAPPQAAPRAAAS